MDGKRRDGEKERESCDRETSTCSSNPPNSDNTRGERRKEKTRVKWGKIVEGIETRETKKKIMELNEIDEDNQANTLGFCKQLHLRS